MSSLPVDMSLLPIDVGFDLRLHDMLVELPAWVRTVAFVDGEEERIINGATSELAAILRGAGYEVRVT